MLEPGNGEHYFFRIACLLKPVQRRGAYSVVLYSTLTVRSKDPHYKRSAIKMQLKKLRYKDAPYLTYRKECEFSRAFRRLSPLGSRGTSQNNAKNPLLFRSGFLNMNLVLKFRNQRLCLLIQGSRQMDCDSLVCLR